MYADAGRELVVVTAIWRFRLAALLIAVIVGGVSISNLMAELLRPAPYPLPFKTERAPTPEEVSSSALAANIAPFRSDLAANRATALAALALKTEPQKSPDASNAAQDAARSALKIGPHDSRMWLLLALLQARNSPNDPMVAESLKMSYLTGPNQSEIIPARLDAVTANNALSDSDLSELAGSDVRALLTQLPGQRDRLVNEYARASSNGKKFLEESVAKIDPAFVDKLRKK
jgi:hypothetical protein